MAESVKAELSEPCPPNNMCAIRTFVGIVFGDGLNPSVYLSKLTGI